MQRFALASALLLGATACAFAQAFPPGYPADYQAIIAAAEQEGSVVVYSTTDSASADVLLKDIGTDLLLLILVGTSLLGALITWLYAIETKGVNLEKIHERGVDPR